MKLNAPPPADRIETSLFLTTSGPRVAVVLGAAVWTGGEPSTTLKRRAEHAVALYNAQQIDLIVPCGGLGFHPPSEAEAIMRLCSTAGVPIEAMYPEDQSTTTRENLALAKPILAALRPSKITIVTAPYHAPRALLIAHQLGIPASARVPALSQIGPRQWLKHLPREALAIVATVLRIR